MNRLGLRAKLATGFGMLLALLVLLGGVSYYSLLRVTAATEEANSSLTRKQHAALTEVDVRKQIQAANEYTFTGEAPSLQRYSDARQEAQSSLDELDKMLIAEKDKALLAKLRQSVQQITSLTEQQLALRRANRNYEATDMAFGPKEQKAIKSVADDASLLEEWEDAQAQNALLAEHNAQAQANFVRSAGALRLPGVELRSPLSSPAQSLAECRECLA